MKPPAFDYAAPTDLGSALRLLANPDVEAKVLAGGQSLVPMLNLRLARPELVVDIARIPELAHLQQVDGALHIGALTTHSRLEASPLVRRDWPLLSEAARHIGHVQIRNAGTVGGSLAHADPAAELPAAMLALDARMVIESAAGRRSIDGRDFFRGQLETALGPDDILTEIVVPAPPARSGFAFAEFARRSGDFAIAGAAVRVTLTRRGRCESAAVALLGAGPAPLRAERAERALIGLRLTGPDVLRAAEAAVAGIRPTGDLHGSGRYRADLLTAIVAQCVDVAVARARAGKEDE